jgi:hypothetical protein
LLSITLQTITYKETYALLKTFAPYPPQNCDSFDLGKRILPYDKNMDIINAKPYISDYPITVL